MGGGDILSNNPNGCVDKWGWCAGGCGNVTYWGFRDCIKGAFSFFNPYSFQFSPIKLKPINIKLTAGVLNTTNIQEQRYSFEFSKLFDLTEPSSTVDFRNISSQVYLNPQTRIPYYSTGFKCPKPYVYDQNTKLYNLITSSQNNNHCNKELTQTIFNYLPRPLRVYILKYLVKMNDIFNEKMNTKNDLNGSNGVITYDIPGFNSLDTKLLNQIAQTFYVNNNGSVSIQKIYDALTIGKTIVDVRCDIAVHADPTRLTNEIEKLRLQYENDMTQSYMTQSEVDTLVNRYLDKLNTLYQIQYENIESIQLNSLLRIYLDNNQNVTGYYKEVNVDAPIVALSFNPLYNGGIPVSVDNSYGGRLASYKPLVSFTKNVGVWGGPRDEATLRRVMRDYELQILSDLSGEYINVDNNYDPIGSERIYVDEVNAVADITTPAPSTPTNPPDLTKNPYTKQIIIQWKQSKYNIITNELITGSRRTFIARFAYVLNTYNWYSNQYVFDASGFKFADYNDGNTENTICSSDDPSYSCDPSDTNPPKFRGGVVAGSTVAGELGTTDGSPQFTVKTGGTTSYPLSTTFDSAKYSTTYPNTIKLTSLTTPIKIMRPLPNDTDNLDNASGECSSVVADTDCTSSAILYKLMTYYNTLENRDPSKSGAIVRITKAVTPSAYQCDVEVEMDYSQNLPAVGSPPTTGLQKETRSFSVALNLTTCDHYVVDVSGVNSGLFILPNTPALFPPAAYAELVLDDANRDDTFVPESMKGTVEKAVNLIKEYREETAETSGRLYTLQGCPNATNRENVCASPEIMDQFAASYKTLYPGTPYDIGRIIRANTVNSTTCDYVFERNRFLDNNKSVLLSKSILGARVNFLTSACAIQSIKEVLPTATWQEIQNVDGSAAPLFTGSYTPTGRMIQGEGDTAVYWLRSDTFEKSFIKNAATPFTSNSGPSVQPDTIPGLEMWYEFDKFTTGSSSLASSLTTGGASLSFPSGQTFSSVMSITLKSKKLLRVTKSQSIFFPFTKTYTDYTITILSRQTGGQNQSVLVSNVNNNSKYTFGYDAGKKNVVFSKGANGTIGALYDKNYTPPVSNTEWDFYTFTRESLSPVQTGTTPGIMTVYRNGSKLYSGRADSLLSSLGINSSGIDGYSSDCEVAEFLFYNRVLYKNEIQSVEEYLGSKWLVRSTGTSEISIGSYTSAQGRFDSAVTKSDMYDSLTMTPGTINDPSTPLVVVTSQQTGEEKLVFPGVAWFDASILPQQSYTNGTLFPSRFSSTDSTYKLHSNFEHIYNGGFTMTSGTVGYTKLNGLPILTLSSRQSLKMTALVEPLSSWTLMYVARHYGNGPYGTVFQSVNTNSVYGLSANKYTYKMNDLNFVTITGPQPEPSNTNWVLVTITCTNEADFNMYWNGTLKNSGSLANQTNADGIDGTYFDGVSINTINTSNTDSIDVQRANCEIAEFLIYNRAVTDKERLQVEGYLISKWGLLNIWSTQSYDESKVPSSNMVARFDASTLTKGSYVSTDAIPYSTGSNFTIRGNPNVKSYMLNMKSVLNLRPSDGLSMKANTAGYTSWTFTYLARHTGDNVSFSTATNVGLDTNAQWPLQGQNINHTARSISSPSTTFTPYPDSACTSYLENWSFPTESSTDRFASPILTQDRIYLMNTNYVYAIDKSTGSRIWKFTSLDGSRMFGSGVLNSNGTLLYGCTYYGSLCAINTSNGTLNWSYTIPNADKSTVNVPAPWNDFPQKTNFITSGLAIDSNGVLYFGSYNSYVYAVRAPTSGTTGVLAWKYKTNAAIDRCTPAVDVDNTIYIGSYDKTLYALRAPAATATGAAATTGVLVWKFECQNQNVSSSISIGTFMIRATATATPTATKVILFGTSCSTTGVATSYVYAVKAPASGTTALEVWKFQTYHYVRSTPLIGSDGNVYFGSWDWSLYCINGTDGTLKWSYPTNEYLDVNPAIGKNGMIYVGGYGTLYALKAPPSTATGTAARTGVVGWTYKIPTNGFLGSPAIDTTGNLYVGTALDVDGALYSINTCTIANYGTLFTGVGTIGTTQLSQTTILGHYCPDTTVSNNSYKKVLKYATGANITTDTTERNDTSWALVTISYDGTTHNMWWNGAQVVTNVANTSLVAKAFQGVGVNDVTNTSSLNSNSEIAEFFVYSRAITNDERTNLESYITKKWGLNAASASASASASTTTTQVSRTIPQMLSSGGLFWMDGSLSSFSSQFTGTSSLQFTATGSPVFQTDSTSNRKILNFTTTQKVSVPISLGENNKSFTLLFVTRQSGTNKDRVFQGVTQPNIFGYSSGYKGTFNKSYSSMTGESPWFGNPNRWKRSNTDWDLFTMQFDGVSNVGAIYMNGAQIAYERVPTQNQIIFDGLSINKSNPSDCQLAEVIVYNRVITDMERIQLEGYLQAKWRVGALTVPDQISGGLMWMDASVYDADLTKNTTLTNINIVRSQFLVTSSNYAMKGESIVKQNVLNGLPVFGFSTSQYISLPLSTPLTSWTVTVVCRQIGGQNQPILTSTNGWQTKNTGDSYSQNVILGYWNGFKKYILINDSLLSQRIDADSQWDLITVTYEHRSSNGSVINAWWNGVQITNSTHTGAIRLNGLAINLQQDINDRADCEVAELLLYNRVITNAERLSLEAYLNKKWGLTPDAIPEPATCEALENTAILTTIDRVPASFIDALPNGPDFTCDMTKINYATSGDFIYDISGGSTAQLYWRPNGSPVKYKVTDANMKCPNGIIPNHSRVGVTKEFLNKLSLQNAPFSCVMMSRRYTLEGQFLTTDQIRFYWIPKNRVVKYTVPSTITSITDGTPILDLSLQVTSDILDAIPPAISTDPSSEVLTFSNNMISLDYIPGDSVTYDIQSEIYREDPISNQAIQSLPELGIVDCAPKNGDTKTLMPYIDEPTLNMVNTYMNKNVDVKNTLQNVFGVSGADMDVEYMGVDISSNAYMFKLDDQYDSSIQDRTFGIQMYTKTSCDLPTEIAGHDIYPSFSYAEQEPSTKKYKKLRLRIYKTRDITSPIVMLNKIKFYDENYKVIPSSTYSIASVSLSNGARNWIYTLGTDSNGNYTYGTNWLEEKISNWKYSNLLVYFNDPLPFVYGFSFITANELLDNATNNRYVDAENYPISSADADPLRWKLDGSNNDKVWTTLHEMLDTDAPIPTDRVAQSPMFLTRTSQESSEYGPTAVFMASWYYKNLKNFLKSAPSDVTTMNQYRSYYSLINHYSIVGLDLGIVSTYNSGCQLDPIWYYATHANSINVYSIIKNMKAIRDLESSSEDRQTLRDIIKQILFFKPDMFGGTLVISTDFNRTLNGLSVSSAQSTGGVTFGANGATYYRFSDYYNRNAIYYTNRRIQEYDSVNLEYPPYTSIMYAVSIVAQTGQITVGGSGQSETKTYGSPGTYYTFNDRSNNIFYSSINVARNTIVTLSYFALIRFVTASNPQMQTGLITVGGKTYGQSGKYYRFTDSKGNTYYNSTPVINGTTVTLQYPANITSILVSNVQEQGGVITVGGKTFGASGKYYKFYDANTYDLNNPYYSSTPVINGRTATLEYPVSNPPKVIRYAYNVTTVNGQITVGDKTFGTSGNKYYKFNDYYDYNTSIFYYSDTPVTVGSTFTTTYRIPITSVVVYNPQEQAGVITVDGKTYGLSGKYYKFNESGNNNKFYYSDTLISNGNRFTLDTPIPVTSVVASNIQEEDGVVTVGGKTYGQSGSYYKFYDANNTSIFYYNTTAVIANTIVTLEYPVYVTSAFVNTQPVQQTGVITVDNKTFGSAGGYYSYLINGTAFYSDTNDYPDISTFNTGTVTKTTPFSTVNGSSQTNAFYIAQAKNGFWNMYKIWDGLLYINGIVQSTTSFEMIAYGEYWTYPTSTGIIYPIQLQVIQEYFAKKWGFLGYLPTNYVPLMPYLMPSVLMWFDASTTSSIIPTSYTSLYPGTGIFIIDTSAANSDKSYITNLNNKPAIAIPSTRKMTLSSPVDIHEYTIICVLKPSTPNTKLIVNENGETSLIPLINSRSLQVVSFFSSQIPKFKSIMVKDCILAELIFFTQYIPDVEQIRVENYLRVKWGIGAKPLDAPIAKSTPQLLPMYKIPGSPSSTIPVLWADASTISYGGNPNIPTDLTGMLWNTLNGSTSNGFTLIGSADNLFLTQGALNGLPVLSLRTASVNLTGNEYITPGRIVQNNPQSLQSFTFMFLGRIVGGNGGTIFQGFGTTPGTRSIFGYYKSSGRTGSRKNIAHMDGCGWIGSAETGFTSSPYPVVDERIQAKKTDINTEYFPGVVKAVSSTSPPTFSILFDGTSTAQSAIPFSNIYYVPKTYQDTYDMNRNWFVINPNTGLATDTPARPSPPTNFDFYELVESAPCMSTNNEWDLYTVVGTGTSVSLYRFGTKVGTLPSTTAMFTGVQVNPEQSKYPLIGARVQVRTGSLDSSLSLGTIQSISTSKPPTFTILLDGKTTPEVNVLLSNIIQNDAMKFPYGKDQSSDCDIAEVLLWNTALTDVERHQYEQYLTQKWGLADSMKSKLVYSGMGLEKSLHTTCFSPIDIDNLYTWLDASTLPTGALTTWTSADPSLSRQLTGASGSITVGPSADTEMKEKVVTFTNGTMSLFGQSLAEYTIVYLARQVANPTTVLEANITAVTQTSTGYWTTDWRGNSQYVNQPTTTTTNTSYTLGYRAPTIASRSLPYAAGFFTFSNTYSSVQPTTTTSPSTTGSVHFSSKYVYSQNISITYNTAGYYVFDNDNFTLLDFSTTNKPGYTYISTVPFTRTKVYNTPGYYVLMHTSQTSQINNSFYYPAHTININETTVPSSKNLVNNGSEPSATSITPSNTNWDLFSIESNIIDNAYNSNINNVLNTTTVTRNSGLYTTSINPTTKKPESTPVGPITGFTLNSAKNSTFEVAEILIYNRKLHSHEVRQLEGYLAWKWGLQSKLDLKHIFKLTPPSSISIYTDGYRYIKNNPFNTSKDICPAYSVMNMKLLPQLQSLSCPLAISNGLLWIDASAYKPNTQFTGSIYSVHPSFQRYLNVVSGTAYISYHWGGASDGLYINSNVSVLGGNFQLTTQTYTIGVISKVVNWAWTPVNFMYNISEILSTNACTSSGLSDLAGMVPGGTGYVPILCDIGINSGSYTSGSECYCGFQGNAPGSTQYFIFELLQYQNAPTLDQQARLQGYLAWKWRIADKLPADPVTGGTHRYRFSQPPPDGFNPSTCIA